MTPNQKIRKKYQHIAFDLDGTLVRTTAEYRLKIVPLVVKALGGKIVSTRSIDKFWFESGRDEIIKQEFKVNPQDFWLLFKKIDTPEQRSLHTQPFQDALPALLNLKKTGKKISIITGAPLWIAQMEIQKLKGEPYDYYLSITDSEFKEKPAPESFHFVLEKMQFSVQETLYVGNSNEDAYFAKNAGVDFLYLERDDYQFDKNDWIAATIYSLKELNNFIL